VDVPQANVANVVGILILMRLEVGIVTAGAFLSVTVRIANPSRAEIVICILAVFLAANTDIELAWMRVSTIIAAKSNDSTF
jgi:hypothetical protein